MAKAVSYRLIEPSSDAGRTMYPLLNELIEKHHEELTNARIALAWNLSWKPDVDGRVTLGKCKRASDLDRELHRYDFVIMLQQEFYQDARVTDAQRRALLDHELCHAAVKLDEAGQPMLDDLDRVVYRIRKHDVEEFSEIVARYGTYKRDLENFAQALNRAKEAGKNPMLPGFEERASAALKAAFPAGAVEFVAPHDPTYDFDETEPPPTQAAHVAGAVAPELQAAAEADEASA